MKVLSAYALAAMLVLSGSSRLNADPIRDQVFLPSNPCCSVWPNSNLLAQTFTVGTSGTLAEVAIPLLGTDPVTVEVRRTTANGLPDDAHAALAHALVVLSPSSSFEWVTADVNAFHIAVRPGDLLAIVLKQPGSMGWAWQADYAAYDGGQPFLHWDAGTEWKSDPEVFGLDIDFLFATSVTPVPEPGTLFLVAGGAACLLKRRRVLHRMSSER